MQVFDDVYKNLKSNLNYYLSCLDLKGVDTYLWKKIDKFCINFNVYKTSKSNGNGNALL